MIRAKPVPSVKTLTEYLGLSPEKARQARRYMTGELDPRIFASVSAWVDKCYNEPSQDELIMSALNEVLGGFGVEVVDTENSERAEYVDNYYRYFVASYVNMGDTYDMTILLDHRSGLFKVVSWGDFVEKN